MTRASPRWTSPSTASWRPAAGPAWWSTRPPGPRVWPAPGAWTRRPGRSRRPTRSWRPTASALPSRWCWRPTPATARPPASPGPRTCWLGPSSAPPRAAPTPWPAASRPRPSACSPREVAGLGQGREVLEDLVEAVVAGQAEDHLMGPSGAGRTEVVRHLIDGSVVRRASRGERLVAEGDVGPHHQLQRIGVAAVARRQVADRGPQRAEALHRHALRVPAVGPPGDSVEAVGRRAGQ